MSSQIESFETITAIRMFQQYFKQIQLITLKTLLHCDDYTHVCWLGLLFSDNGLKFSFIAETEAKKMLEE